jgi:DNA-binding HxlR family transcriptional regulator
MSTVKLENITEQTPTRRRYDDACGAAHALDLLGERWALLVVRELMLGPRRFSALRAALPGVSANTLTQRLEGLEAAGVLVRRRLPPPASTNAYELTPWGYESEPIFQALGRWAARSPSHDPTLPFSAASLFLSLRTNFDAVRAGDWTRGSAFASTMRACWSESRHGRLTFARDPLDEATLVFTGSARSLAALIYGGQPLDALAAAGALTVEGDQGLLAQFLTLFPLPPKVGSAA